MITLKDWIEMNQRDRPISKELTEEYIEICYEYPQSAMVRLARTCGVPQGVDPSDKRIQEFFDVRDTLEIDDESKI